MCVATRAGECEAGRGARGRAGRARLAARKGEWKESPPRAQQGPPATAIGEHKPRQPGQTWLVGGWNEVRWISKGENSHDSVSLSDTHLSQAGAESRQPPAAARDQLSSGLQNVGVDGRRPLSSSKHASLCPPEPCRACRAHHRLLRATERHSPKHRDSVRDKHVCLQVGVSCLGSCVLGSTCGTNQGCT